MPVTRASRRTMACGLVSGVRCKRVGRDWLALGCARSLEPLLRMPQLRIEAPDPKPDQCWCSLEPDGREVGASIALNGSHITFAAAAGYLSVPDALPHRGYVRSGVMLSPFFVTLPWSAAFAQGDRVFEGGGRPKRKPRHEPGQEVWLAATGP
jgi:hypothetical protein